MHRQQILFIQTWHKQNKNHWNNLGLSFCNPLLFWLNKSSADNIHPLQAVFTHCWCLTLSRSSAASCLSCSRLPCLFIPGVIVGFAVNHLHTASPVVKLASFSLIGHLTESHCLDSPIQDYGVCTLSMANFVTCLWQLDPTDKDS